MPAAFSHAVEEEQSRVPTPAKGFIEHAFVASFKIGVEVARRWSDPVASVLAITMGAAGDEDEAREGDHNAFLHAYQDAPSCGRVQVHFEKDARLRPTKSSARRRAPTGTIE